MSDKLPEAPTMTLSEAQRVLDEHPVSGADGKCETCQAHRCPDRAAAIYALADIGQLPQRRRVEPRAI